MSDAFLVPAASVTSSPAAAPGDCSLDGANGAGMKVKLNLEARNPCPACGPVFKGGKIDTGDGVHCPRCGKERPLVGVYVNDYDLGTKQLGQLMMVNILNATSVSMSDTAAASHTVNTNTAITAAAIVAGTSTVAAAVSDVKLGTFTDSVSLGQPSAGTWSGTSGTFTVAGTVTAGADRAYAEVGIQVTVGGSAYLITHDVFSVLNVSSSGTLATTYTITIS